VTSKLLVPAVLALAVGLSGCVSLLPKAKPVQTYSFRTTDVVAAPKVATVTVLRAPTTFPRAAASDRIYTRTGTEAAYVEGARWSAPAQTLFDEALAAAFDAGTVRLATRGEIGPSDAILRVEVRTFAAVYKDGQGAAPTAVVEARASLTSMKDRDLVAAQLFRAEKPAADNRVGAIVDAYDGAVGEVLGQIVGWTSANVKPTPKAKP
jgi:cholesterol transport system auxiliary component